MPIIEDSLTFDDDLTQPLDLLHYKTGLYITSHDVLTLVNPLSASSGRQLRTNRFPSSHDGPSPLSASLRKQDAADGAYASRAAVKVSGLYVVSATEEIGQTLRSLKCLVRNITSVRLSSAKSPTAENTRGSDG